MNSYEIKQMIIDDDFYGEESATVDFTHNNKDYSITFNKADLEIINSWQFEDDKSIPANLSDHIVESIRKDVKKKI